ncbi:hypothetical protein M23134_00113 [Microscilla marina ATCC 23134]|uniref:Uncharacterized protein n=1 Tax=Microscilla marina ATCC 23134 TaxID=313606 RepID=A1ZKZ3_MICM2|nr:hypothetical protein M23134_00113 [Microscilla marina ATCC 23134]
MTIKGLFKVVLLFSIKCMSIFAYDDHYICQHYSKAKIKVALLNDLF